MGEADASRALRLAERVRRGDVRAIARAMRLVDDRTDDHVALLKELHDAAGRAWVLGVTGTAGAGKSTIVDRLIDAFRRQGKKVGVVAVDPTSPFTGGAILGDRIRMQRHFLDDGVFIRSLATRGHMGGLSRSARDVIRVLDAAGFEIVIVETVGVGQDELEVARLAHTTVVVLAPGLGDDIQAIKAGILEIADVFAINKADRDGADATARDIEQTIALGSAPRAIPRRGHVAAAAADPAQSGAVGGTWRPPVVKTVAIRDEGLAELVDACEKHRRFVDETEEGGARRAARREEELRAIFRETLVDAASERLGAKIDRAVEQVARGGADPYAVAESLVQAALREEEHG